MKIKDFAKSRRLTCRQDVDHTPIVAGKSGHLFEYDDSLFGVEVHRNWARASKRFREAGMTITQNGDDEGVAIFDPNSGECVKLALKYADVKRKKTPSTAQLDALARKRGRFEPQGQSGSGEIPSAA